MTPKPFHSPHFSPFDAFNSFVSTLQHKLSEAERERPMPAFTTNTLEIMSYPRTGKRGVPQQFPRRLYEMLQSESKLLESSSDHEDIIAWSDSGKAFRILDVSAFSCYVLPKYFRTSKLSSFQRNLNLVSISDPASPYHVIVTMCHSLTQFFVYHVQYGFAKVRRGPDMDMYAHPTFFRDQPETLSLLRKCTAERKRSPSSSIFEFSSTKSVEAHSRAVSPSPPGSPKRLENISIVQNAVDRSTLVDRSKVDSLNSWKGAGRLDILTMALASLAERDFESNRQRQQV
jgi:hypothetical protein